MSKGGIPKIWRVSYDKFVSACPHFDTTKMIHDNGYVFYELSNEFSVETLNDFFLFFGTEPVRVSKLNVHELFRLAVSLGMPDVLQCLVDSAMQFEVDLPSAKFELNSLTSSDYSADSSAMQFYSDSSMYLVGIKFAQVKSVKIYTVELFEYYRTETKCIYTGYAEQNQKNEMNAINFNRALHIKRGIVYEVVLRDHDRKSNDFGKGIMYDGNGAMSALVNGEIYSLHGVQDSNGECSSKVNTFFLLPIP